MNSSSKDFINSKSFTPLEDLKTTNEIKKEISYLEDLMYTHAKNLEFEEAAEHRDRVDELKERLFRMV